MIVALAVLFACFFAMNIGASGTAASMGAAYGGGAIKSKMIAVTLVGIVALLGAIFGGGEVTKMISEGIIDQKLITHEITVLIIASSTTVLFISNKMGIPLSTSEVTVGSIIGVGFIFKQIYIWKVFAIASVWLILPILAYCFAKLIDKGGRWIEQRWLHRYSDRLGYKRLLSCCLIFFGCYEAFAAGMNNVANAVGPLISSHILSVNQALFLGAVFMCIGAIMLGGPVLETNGKRITKLNLLQGSVVSFTSGSLVIMASLFGIPVPLTQATTMSIIGVGSNRSQQSIWRLPVVKRIVLVWILSPLVAMTVSYSLVYTYLYQSPVPVLLIACGLLFFASYKYGKFGDIIDVTKNK